MKPKSPGSVSLVAVLSQCLCYLAHQISLVQCIEVPWHCGFHQESEVSACVRGVQHHRGPSPASAGAELTSRPGFSQSWRWGMKSLGLLGRQLKCLSFYLVFCALVSLDILHLPSCSIHCHLLTADPLQNSLWQFTWAEELMSAILSSCGVSQCFLNHLGTEK